MYATRATMKATASASTAPWGALRELRHDHAGGERRERLEVVLVRVDRALAPALEALFPFARRAVVVAGPYLGEGDGRVGQQCRDEDAPEGEGHGVVLLLGGA